MVLLDAVVPKKCKYQFYYFHNTTTTHADEYQAQGLRAGDVSIVIARSMISVPELIMICLRRSVLR